jgi:outer membrane protein
MTLLLLAGGSLAQGLRIEVAVVRDGPSDRRILTRDMMRQAVADTVAGNVTIEFPDDRQFAGDWSLAGVDAAIDRALADPGVDVVLALGILASHQAAHRRTLAKPVIAPMVVDPVLQEFPLANGRSGRSNFTYTADFHGIGNDVRAFQKIVGFRHLVALVDQALLDALPELGAKAAALAQELNTHITIVRTADTAAAALSAMPADADAVYVTGLLRFSDAELQALARGLAERRLPSFSLIGRSELERGLLLTSGGAERDNERLSRRIVLMIQRIALGENPADFEVSFPTEQRFAINMQTAQRIGFSPRWDFLADAEQIDAGPVRALPRLTMLDAMRAAIDANPSLAASAARRDSSGAEIGIARSALLPSIDVVGTSTRIDADRASVLTQAEQSTSAGLSATQVIYSERAWAAFAISQSLFEAAQQGYREDLLDLLQSAAAAYLDVLRAKSLESVRRSNVENTRRNLETSRVREEVGLAGRSDYLRWVAELARDKQNLLGGEGKRGQGGGKPRRVIHRPSSEAFATVESGLDDPLSIVSDPRTQGYIDTPASWEIFTGYAVRSALDNSPELARGEAIIASRERSAKAARRAYYLPDLALVSGASTVLSERGAGSGFVPGAPDDDSWSVALQASWPLFAGGQRRAELAKARHELRASEYNQLAAVDLVEARVRIALHRTTASYPAIELSRTAADAAAENLAMVTDAYGRGAVSVTELIDAQDTALEASLAAADARYSFLIDFVDVLRAMSEFDILLDPVSREAWFGRVDEWFRTHAAGNGPQGEEG